MNANSNFATKENIPSNNYHSENSLVPVDWFDFNNNLLEDYNTPEAWRIADNIIAFQRISGGWEKDRNITKVYTPFQIDSIKTEQVLFAKMHDGPDPTIKNYSHSSASFDQGSASDNLRFLLRVAETTNDNKYIDAFNKGLTYFFDAQYPSGGWPQVYPHTIHYGGHVTFNDEAMISILKAMKDISKNIYTIVDEDTKNKATTALNNGIAYILNTQIIINGELTAWAGQYNSDTHQPSRARGFEIPSINGKESTTILYFLMNLQNPSPEVRLAVHSAIAWLDQIKINDTEWIRYDAPEKNKTYSLEIMENPESIFGPTTIEFTEKGYDVKLINSPEALSLWARFYDPTTGTPIFSSWDGVSKSDVQDIHYERRIGYAWYGTWLRSIVGELGDAWKIKYPLQPLAVVDEKLDNATILYPNPTNGYLTIKTPMNQQKWNYKIYSNLGETLQRGTINNDINIIDLNHLNSGLYYLNLTSNNNQKIIQFIKL